MISPSLLRIALTEAERRQNIHRDRIARSRIEERHVARTQEQRDMRLWAQIVLVFTTPPHFLRPDHPDRDLPTYTIEDDNYPCRPGTSAEWTRLVRTARATRDAAIVAADGTQAREDMIAGLIRLHRALEYKAAWAAREQAGRDSHSDAAPARKVA